jgi:spore germination protein KB
MRIEQITDKEAISMLTLYIMGSTLIMGIGGDLKNDAWIAGLTGILFAVPFIVVYSRITSLYHGKELFEILDLSLGKFFAKPLLAIYILYFFHLGALVIRNFGEFINTVTMPETPIIVPMLLLGLLCIKAARHGIEEIGRFCAYLLPVVLLILLIVQLLIIPELNLENIKPVLGEGLMPVLKGGFGVFSFPFAEMVALVGVFSSLKTKKSAYKVFFTSMFFAGSIIIILTIRNIAVLGGTLGLYYFPSYVAVSRISVGQFIQRIEVTVAFVFVMGVFAKSSVCLLAASKGVAGLFRLDNYRSVVIQLGILMIIFSYTVYDNIMEMRYWAFKVYPYYAFPMQVIIPLTIWICAEIRKKRTVKKKC